MVEAEPRSKFCLPALKHERNWRNAQMPLGRTVQLVDETKLLVKDDDAVCEIRADRLE